MRPVTVYRYTVHLSWFGGSCTRRVWAKDFINARWLIDNWPEAFDIPASRYWQFKVDQITHTESDRLATFTLV